MRSKTFLATFLLFLIILFSSLSVVSAYMTSNQMNMLKEKSVAEYQMMIISLTKDIAILTEREKSKDYTKDVNALINNYAKYYEKHNITIALNKLELTEPEKVASKNIEVSFITCEREYYIFITGALSEPFQNYQLDYHYNVTKSIMDMKNIQHILLFVGILFSVITMFALHFILAGIFKPLNIVAKTSKKIADGHYSERIYIKGKHEVAAMAAGFNRMAEQIEKQICLLEKESAQKQQFVDNFAHEIRTPLTSIYGYAEYLQKAALNEEEIIESAQFIIEEARHMKKISNSLLELATLRHYKPIENKISIPQLFEYIKHTMQNVLTERKIQFNYSSDTDILEGQEDLIKSLLLNLCTNAVKACPSNNGIIHLKADRLRDKVIISVTDNGCGIPEENISKVTEAFYRVDKARSREQGGAGLGLAICQQIAAVHGAKLTVESSINIGTTIKVTFTTS